ncbi:MAG: hypothetical protein DMG00_19125 [Acidobacteria bacterium]|nr:MAG: hypothetical protein DMG00_19125 [Acidobacteriota bacterium]
MLLRVLLEVIAGGIVVFLVLGGIAPMLVVAGASKRLLYAVGIALLLLVSAAVLYVNLRRRVDNGSRRDF